MPHRISSVCLFVAVCFHAVLAACAKSSVRTPDDGGEPRGDAGPPVLCDGSSSIRLAFAVRATPFPHAGHFNFENGSSFLIISGMCDYWTFGPPSFDGVQLDDVHTGHLTVAESQSIAERVRYGSLAALAGDYQVDDHYSYDTYITDGVNVIICPSVLCPDAEDPAVPAILTTVSDVVGELYDTGVPVAGDIWYEIEPFDSTLPHTPVEWPLSIPLVPGRGRAATRDAAVLRGIRARVRAGEFCLNCAFIPFRVTGGPTFSVSLRDSIPFEDA